MKKISSDLEIKIIKHYLNNDLNIKNICKTYKISRKTIYNILYRNNIKRKYIPAQLKYNIDLDFFKKIDSDEKAYFLGWLYSDGCMQEDNKSVHISIKESDKSILYELNNLIKSNLPVKTFKRKNIDGYNRQNLCKLSIYRKEIYNDLLKLGLHPNKTETLTFPNDQILCEKYLFSFLRGFLDGDGSIINHNKKLSQSIIFTSNILFIKKLQFILKKYDIKSAINKKINTDKVVDLRIWDNNSVFKLLYYLYENVGNLKLTRKFNKFLDILKKYLNTKSKINIKTIKLFSNYNLYEKFLNIKIDYFNHWRIDTRNY